LIEQLLSTFLVTFFGVKLLHDYGFRPELAFSVASHSQIFFFFTNLSTVKNTYFDNGASYGENVRNKVSFGNAF
jgi:hypothetical protein